MFHTYRKALVSIVLVFCLFSIVSAYSGGTGEPNDPYQIGSVSDWQELMNTSADWNKHFILIADVNLQSVSLTPVGDYNNSSGTDFTGIFDGNSHIIRNVDINMPSSYYVGLFGHSIGQIRNLGVEDVNIRGYYGVGGLTGYSRGIITNCYATGVVTGNNAKFGGLVGWNSNHGIITDCYSACKVNGNGSWGGGGLVGENRGGTITNCYSSGTVTGSAQVGGLVGYNNYAYNDANIIGCYATGTVTGVQYIGGLVGTNNTMVQSTTYQGIVTNCYATGAVSGISDIGGLIGYNNNYNLNSSTNTCYATGTVTGNGRVGGLIGYNLRGTITDCYATGSITGNVGQTYVGGLVGQGNNITNCYATGSVTGNDGPSYVGGLVGYGTNITNCYATGSVTGNKHQICVGGLIGYGGNITNSYATGTVVGNGTGGPPYYIGGLAGYGMGNITNCYATGSVENGGTNSGGDYYIGGLVGSSDSIITNCYAGGTVNAYAGEELSPRGIFYVGGLVGQNNSTIIDCYSTGAVGGNGNYLYIYIGGLVGTGGTVSASFWDVNTSGWSTSAGGEGKTTTEMKTLTTFASAGWDFLGETANGTIDAWRMCVDGVYYPHLSWEYYPYGDFVCPDGVDFYDLAVFVDQWLLNKQSYDLNNDSIVNFLDFVALAENWQGDMSQLLEFSSQWLQPSVVNADIAPAPGDGIVNFIDFAAFADNWLEGI